MKNKEIKIFDSDVNGFAVHIEGKKSMFSENTSNYDGVVYPVIYYKHISNGKSGWEYYGNGNEDSEMHYEELNDKCKVMFRFSFCWRGVWEGRICFPNDEEFWSEDLKDISNLWNKIEAYLQKKIKLDNPQYEYD